MKPNQFTSPHKYPDIIANGNGGRIQLPPLTSLTANEKWPQRIIPTLAASSTKNSSQNITSETAIPNTNTQIIPNKSAPNSENYHFKRNIAISSQTDAGNIQHTIKPAPQPQIANRNLQPFNIQNNSQIQSFHFENQHHISTTPLNATIIRDFSHPSLSRNFTLANPNIHQSNTYIAQSNSSIPQNDLYPTNRPLMAAIPIAVACQNSTGPISNQSSIPAYQSQQITGPTLFIPASMNVNIIQQTPPPDNSAYLISHTTPPQTAYIASTPQYQSNENSLDFRTIITSNSESDPLDRILNPIELNFTPKELWISQRKSLRQIIQEFFHARSTKNLRFEHKLWNALSLSIHYPDLNKILGIQWVSNDVLKVNRDIFGSLINVTKPSAALFNSQGSFQTHGFIEISKSDALTTFKIPLAAIEDVDESIVRLYRHSEGKLTANSHKNDISTCRWNR